MGSKGVKTSKTNFMRANTYGNNLSNQSGTKNQKETLPFFCQIRFFSNLDRFLIQNGVQRPWKPKANDLESLSTGTKTQARTYGCTPENHTFCKHSDSQSNPKSWKCSKNFHRSYSSKTCLNSWLTFATKKRSNRKQLKSDGEWRPDS